MFIYKNITSRQIYSTTLNNFCGNPPTRTETPRLRWLLAVFQVTIIVTPTISKPYHF